MTNKATSVWYPHMWTFLFSSALSQKSNSQVVFLNNLGHILPDTDTRDIYSKYLEKNPLTEGADTNILDWLLGLRNMLEPSRPLTKATLLTELNNKYRRKPIIAPPVRSHATPRYVPARKMGGGCGCGGGRR